MRERELESEREREIERDIKIERERERRKPDNREREREREREIRETEGWMGQKECQSAMERLYDTEGREAVVDLYKGFGEGWTSAP